jgi:SNF2 family DNA or RNA helicase
LKSESDLYKYQRTAVQHILGLNGSMLWMDIGLGKTVVSLTAISNLLDSFKIRGALVVSTVKIVEAVWQQEVEEWEHTRHLRCSLVRGTPSERMTALMDKAKDIYLINYEQLMWLQKTLQEHWIDKERLLPFDLIVFDEVSKMKNSTSKRAKAFKKMLPHFPYRIGLTGTPAANGYQDLHGQYLVVDGGVRLGPNISTFRDRWFIQNPYSYKYQPRTGAPKEIRKRIADITLEMNKADYLELPPFQDIDYNISLPPEVMQKYVKFEKEYFVSIGSDEVEAFNAAAKSTKCRQLANGAVYVTDADTGKRTGEWSHFHDEKLDTLAEIIESLNGKPLLVCYQFIHDRERLQKCFPKAVFMDGKSDTADIVNRWNKGKIQLLMGHPKSMGHGLNLQYGGHHIAWFGLTWSGEEYWQAIGRLFRTGQKNTVMNHRIIAKGTIEHLVMSPVLKDKNATQEKMRYAVKVYRDQMIERRN